MNTCASHGISVECALSMESSLNVGIYQGVITKCLALNPSARSLPEVGWFEKVRPSFGDGIKAALKPENQAKWIEVWPEAIADESVQCSGQPIVDAKCSGQPIVENSDQWDDDADHDWKVPPTLKGPSFEL